jgi:hypothetical protein
VQPENPTYSCWAVAAFHRTSRTFHQRWFCKALGPNDPNHFSINSVAEKFAGSFYNENSFEGKSASETAGYDRQPASNLRLANKLRKSTATFLRGRFESG